MLDITKIEQGKLDMVHESASLLDIVRSITADLSGYSDKSNVSIVLDIPENVYIHVDVSRARQALQNLIDNAIKYSKNPGRVEISCQTNGNFVKVILKDDGIGIPDSEQPKIFSRFYRASNTADSNSGGSGLGLYIVRSIVSQLGGSIFFESKEGVGTTFNVTFPIYEIKLIKSEF
ncbi:MAG: hypothetical protein RLZZ230_174 [Candidatus Parcubacteria bacterium]|jgi:two-component system phosphate regulon sensor histidine kinase PhoR